MGATRVIGVHLSAHWVNLQGPRHIFDVIGQCFSIAQQKMCGPWQAAADLVLSPDVRGYSYDSFDRARELIEAGEAVTRQAMPIIRQWLEEAVEPGSTPVKATPPQVLPA
jgi:hypothetical protein